MTDNVEEARRLVEEPSGDLDAVEHSRALIEGGEGLAIDVRFERLPGPHEESEIERARR